MAPAMCTFNISLIEWKRADSSSRASILMPAPLGQMFQPLESAERPNAHPACRRASVSGASEARGRSLKY
jgi:hypothetical protein